MVGKEEEEDGECVEVVVSHSLAARGATCSSFLLQMTYVDYPPEALDVASLAMFLQGNVEAAEALRSTQQRRTSTTGWAGVGSDDPADVILFAAMVYCIPLLPRGFTRSAVSTRPGPGIATCTGSFWARYDDEPRLDEVVACVRRGLSKLLSSPYQVRATLYPVASSQSEAALELAMRPGATLADPEAGALPLLRPHALDQQCPAVVRSALDRLHRWWTIEYASAALDALD